MRRRRGGGRTGGAARRAGRAARGAAEPPAEPAEPPAETAEPPAETGAGPDEFGETYDADPAVIEQALFDATLLPEDPVAEQVALAAFARADDPVDQDLALECWQNNGCDTGTGGELTVAYVEPFGENVYREMSKMEFILQALTYPEIGEIIYKSANVFSSSPGDPLADFQSVIAQGADVIVNFPDIGDQYLPVFQEATAAGIPVATYAWGYVTGPGENYSTVVGEDTCALGEAFAQQINDNVGSGKIALMGGTPGNPLSASWQECERAALNPEIEIVGTYDTNWVPARSAGGDGEPPRGSPGPEGHQLRVLGRNGARRPAGHRGGGHPDRPGLDDADRRAHSRLHGRRAERAEPPDLLRECGRQLADPHVADGGHDAAQGLHAAADDRVPDRVQGQLGGEPVRRGPTR